MALSSSSSSRPSTTAAWAFFQALGQMGSSAPEVYQFITGDMNALKWVKTLAVHRINNPINGSQPACSTMLNNQVTRWKEYPDRVWVHPCWQPQCKGVTLAARQRMEKLRAARRGGSGAAAAASSDGVAAAAAAGSADPVPASDANGDVEMEDA